MKNKVIAVVGASRSPEKYGHQIFRDLLKNNYRVYGVNPNSDSLFNQEVYKCLEEVPEKIDVVVFVTHPKVTEEVLKECVLLGIKEIWFQPGSESMETLNFAREHRMKFHNHCFMVDEGLW